MVKILSFYIFSILSLIGVSQDTILPTSTNCPIKLQQICPHINNTYIGLDDQSKLVLLDSNFALISYGPSVQYINLNDYQSPLQIIALNDLNQIIYLDQNLNINRTVTPPNSDFIHFVSVNKNLGLWLPLEGKITLYDPNFGNITQQIPYPNVTNIIKTATVNDTFYLLEPTLHHQYINNELIQINTPLEGVFSSNNQLFRYDKAKLWYYKEDIKKSYYFNEKTSYIHLNGNKLLLINNKGELKTKLILSK